MDTKRVTSEYRFSQWAQIMQARHDSGQSIKDFCEAAGIKRHAYFYWQRRLREKACAELERIEEPGNLVPNGWVQLAPPRPPHQIKGTLGIEISGCYITVTDDTDPELLKKICRVLRSL